MLKQYPTARFILQRGAWYLLTFLVAVTINFVLPRLGSSNPVDIIMGKVSSGLSADAAREKEEGYLKEFGLVKVDDKGAIVRDTAFGKKQKIDTIKTGDVVKYDTIQAVDTIVKPRRTTLLEQFGSYLKMSLHGDLGTSFEKQKKVMTVTTIPSAIP